MTHAEIVEQRRRDGTDVVEYFLTEAGVQLKPVLTQNGEWGQRWARDIRPEDLDPGWLVWNMHRRLDTARMPAGRTVIQIEFEDARRNHRHFWLVNAAGNVEVCLKPPCFAVDLTVRTTMLVLAETWRGLRDVRREIRAGRIRLTGTQAIKRSFPGWLLLSVYAPIRRLR